MNGPVYSYTIGTDGSLGFSLLNEHLVPLLIGCEAEEIELILRRLFFYIHVTTVGVLTFITLAAIDTAL